MTQRRVLIVAAVLVLATGIAALVMWLSEPPPRVREPYVRSIGFNDEACDDAHFSAALDHVRQLKVGAVRLWHSADWSSDRVSDANASLRRAFALHDAGIDVLLVVQAGEGKSTTVPPDADSVKRYFSALLAYAEPDGNRTLKDVVDRWEIGNEVNLDRYFVTGADDKDYKPRLELYVDRLLVPAANVLEEASEPCGTAGLSWGGTGPLDHLLKKIPAGTMKQIDFICYHPYAAEADQAKLAEAVNASVEKYASGKPVYATEWNVSHKKAYEGKYDEWAKAIERCYPQATKAFDRVYYFAILDNELIRGGQGMHRPASVLRHEKEDDASTPLVPNEHFYDAFRRLHR